MQSQYPVVDAVLIGTKAIGISVDLHCMNHTDTAHQVQDDGNGQASGERSERPATLPGRLLDSFKLREFEGIADFFV